MEPVARFASRGCGRRGAARRQACSYTPYDERRVVNASAYRAFLLAAAGTRFGHPDWVAEARAAAAFVLWSQRSDGSWLYAMDGKDAFVDNFHTCFVLKNLYKTWVALGDDSLLEAVEAGYRFYKSFLLDRTGLPIPFARTQRLTLRRRELYDYAEGISLALLLRSHDRDAVPIAERLLDDLLTSWQLPDGHFVTRLSWSGRNTIPYHRWAQAQTFCALGKVCLSR